MNKIAVIILVLFLSCCIPGDAVRAEEKAGRKKPVKYVKSKDGIKALMAFAKSHGKMIQELKEETENYRKIAAALDRGQLKHGESAKRIKTRYGEPVIVLSEEGERLTKWVYKPSDKSFFSDEKVYLIFNKENELIGWHSR